MIKIDTVSNINTNNTPAYKGRQPIRWTEKAIQEKVAAIMSEATVTGGAPSGNIFSDMANRVKDIAMIIKSGRVSDKSSLNIVA